MEKIKINLDDLVSSFTFNSEGISKEYLNTETGEIIHIPEEVGRAIEDGETDNLPDWEKDLIEDAEAIYSDEEEKYLLIPNIESHYFYNAMMEFADEEIEDENLSVRLLDALNGSQPMRSFKDILHEHSDELDRWYEYEDKKSKEYVIEWLEKHGIEFIPTGE